MKCEQFERRMHQLLDRRLPPEADASLRAHAVVCPSCHEMLEVQGLLLGQVALPFPTRDAANRPSHNQTPRPGEALPHGTWWGSSTFLTVCASILCLLAVSQVLTRPARTDPKIDRLSPDGGIAEPTFSHAAESYTLTLEVAPSSTAAISHTLVGMQLVSHTDWSSLAPFSAAVAPGLRPGLNLAWIERVAGSVQPLADSVTSAIHILKRALPSGQAENAPGHADPQAALGLPLRQPSIWA